MSTGQLLSRIIYLFPCSKENRLGSRGLHLDGYFSIPGRQDRKLDHGSRS